MIRNERGDSMLGWVGVRIGCQTMAQPRIGMGGLKNKSANLSMEMFLNGILNIYKSKRQCCCLWCNNRMSRRNCGRAKWFDEMVGCTVVRFCSGRWWTILDLRKGHGYEFALQSGWSFRCYCCHRRSNRMFMCVYISRIKTNPFEIF